MKKIKKYLKKYFSLKDDFNYVPELTIVSQFFTPDYAATGQLLDDLSKRLAKNDIEIKNLTGFPSYALKIKNCPEKEFYKKREIVRTRYANFWPKRFMEDLLIVFYLLYLQV